VSGTTFDDVQGTGSSWARRFQTPTLERLQSPARTASGLAAVLIPRRTSFHVARCIDVNRALAEPVAPGECPSRAKLSLAETGRVRSELLFARRNQGGVFLAEMAAI
jgi:hypothetical protein